MCGFKQNNCTELTCCFQETCMVHNLGTDHLTFCELCDVSADVTARFDSVFWCGDLNFRLERRRNAVEGKVTQMQDAASIPHFEELLGADQLSKYITEGQCFPLAMPHCCTSLQWDCWAGCWQHQTSRGDFGKQLHGDKECTFSGVTSSSRERVLESESWSEHWSCPVEGKEKR